MIILHRFSVFLPIALITLFLIGAARVHLPEVRAIWVTRFDYKTPVDVKMIVVNCARAGFTDIFFQIRGNGTVFYPSRVEPWAFELSGNEVSLTGRNPGWDPLQTAVEEARGVGIRLHAYMNVLPGWRGLELPPRSVGQLRTAYPDWFMVDSTGVRMRATSRWYSFLNPAHLAVRTHLTQLVNELASYDLAGLHLDYIRFPYDYKNVAHEIYPSASSKELKAHSDFSYDRVTISMVRTLFGNDVSHHEWDRFRRSTVSQTVLELKKAFEARRGPQAVVSSSVLADFNDGYHLAFQDSRRWAKEGRVDWLVPMNYNAKSFDARLKKMRCALGRRSTGKQLVVGIDCKANPSEIMRQIIAVRKAGCRGVALFAYSHLFKNHQPTEKARVLLHP